MWELVLGAFCMLCHSGGRIEVRNMRRKGPVVHSSDITFSIQVCLAVKSVPLSQRRVACPTLPGGPV